MFSANGLPTKCVYSPKNGPVPNQPRACQRSDPDRVYRANENQSTAASKSSACQNSSAKIGGMQRD